MTGVLQRLTAAFVAPAESRPGAARGRVAEDAAPAAVAVLCRARDAWTVGGAVALALGGGPAVVVAWGAGRPPAFAVPATVGARRLAARLAGRGHAAGASGSLVRISATAGPDEASRVAGAAQAPVVCVLAGPRDEEVDAVLRTQDRVLAAADPQVAELAARGAAALGVPARVLDVPQVGAQRALAAAGVTLAGQLRPAVRAALR